MLQNLTFYQQKWDFFKTRNLFLFKKKISFPNLGDNHIFTSTRCNFFTKCSNKIELVVLSFFHHIVQFYLELSIDFNHISNNNMVTIIVILVKIFFKSDTIEFNFKFGTQGFFAFFLLWKNGFIWWDLNLETQAQFQYSRDGRKMS